MLGTTFKFPNFVLVSWLKPILINLMVIYLILEVFLKLNIMIFHHNLIIVKTSLVGWFSSLNREIFVLNWAENPSAQALAWVSSAWTHHYYLPFHDMILKWYQYARQCTVMRCHIDKNHKYQTKIFSSLPIWSASSVNEVKKFDCWTPSIRIRVSRTNSYRWKRQFFYWISQCLEGCNNRVIIPC